MVIGEEKHFFTEKKRKIAFLEMRFSQWFLHDDDFFLMF